jgi:hypothetical protein
MRSRAVKDVEEDAQRGWKIQTVAEYIIGKGIWNPSRGDGSMIPYRIPMFAIPQYSTTRSDRLSMQYPKDAWS